MDPKQQKSDLRTAIKQRLDRLSPKEKAAESRTLCREIIKLLPAEPGAITVYYVMPNEPDLDLLIEELFARGWAVFFPRFEAKELRFRQAGSLAELVKGEWGIPEPPISAPLLDPAALDIAIIPARAYNRTGERMGRGNGGYDIWIRKQRKANPRTQYWGVCFFAQIMNEIPMEEHDEKVDKVVTAKGVVFPPPKK